MLMLIFACSWRLSKLTISNLGVITSRVLIKLMSALSGAICDQTFLFRVVCFSAPITGRTEKAIMILTAASTLIFKLLAEKEFESGNATPGDLRPQFAWLLYSQ
jgi:hypothetical protein